MAAMSRRRVCVLLVAQLLRAGGAEEVGGPGSTVSPRRKGRTVRWGVMGTGSIASDMARVLMQLEHTELAAVGSRSAARAGEFATEVGLKGAALYGSYEDLVHDESLDVVYVATPSVRHVADSLACLEAGRAVLCEKAMATSAEEATRVLECAARKGLFFLHGVWSRFFPAMAEIRRIIDAGEIGEVYSAHASFCQNDGAGAASAALETGVYCAQFLLWAFGGATPRVDGVYWHRAPDAPHEDHVAAILRFPNGVGTLECSLRHASPREATICGTKGVIRVPFPFWCPTGFTVQQVGGLASQTFSRPREYRFALPSVSGKFNFVHSEGLAYEAEAVNACLRDGRIQAEAFSSGECLDVMRIVSRLREAAMTRADRAD